MAHRIRAGLLAAGAGLMALSGLAAPSAFAQSGSRAEIARPMADAPYWNASLPVEQRVADLLARMTLDEKIAQIITVWNSKNLIQDADHSFSAAKAAQVYPNGIGQIARPSDSSRARKARSVLIAGGWTRPVTAASR